MGLKIKPVIVGSAVVLILIAVYFLALSRDKPSFVNDTSQKLMSIDFTCGTDLKRIDFDRGIDMRTFIPILKPYVYKEKCDILEMQIFTLEERGKSNFKIEVSCDGITTDQSKIATITPTEINRMITTSTYRSCGNYGYVVKVNWS